METIPRRLDVVGREDAELRILTPDDWRIEHDLSRVADVPTWTMYPPDLTKEQSRARAGFNVDLVEAGLGIRYLVIEAGTIVGTAGFGRRADGDHELFYALKPEGRGRGLATDAVRTLVDWLHASGARRLWLSTLDGNIASENVARRAGFVAVGTGVHVDGRPLTQWRRGL
ncbi:GNAT family N-acetyltransferase [Leifsonia sp. NPDC058292]|uniref:GNAT family N-acetyltransferase n=1 Tax=Leifsonia sp. NPDC058292 TaxID=3346428 RepID=UPI0036DC83DE